ncbi:type II secretion system protein GspI [Variovorax sp. AFSI2.2]|uniref:type II secretion system protein GspI n=1 Tax=Variovorax sp. AFSI2.2 TaxID=3384160 RepID=UPI003EBC4E87
MRCTRLHRAGPHGVQGISLLEVLVALLVLSIGLIAAVRSTGLTAANALRLRTQMCADWVGQNRLELHHARADWLDAGIQPAQAERQCGLDFVVVEEVSDTPSPLARKVDVHVSLKDDPTAKVVVQGYLIHQSNPRPGEPF